MSPYVGPSGEEISRLLNLREACAAFGLNHHQIYTAVRRGHLHPVQLNGKGRIYYAEWELLTLTNIYGVLGGSASPVPAAA